MAKKTRLAELHKQISPSSKPTHNAPPPHNATMLEANAPRGQRSDFLKLTITMPAQMLAAMKAAGMKRKAAGQKDCDTSSLIREAVAAWLLKQSD